jgi:Flp pilus assembly protein TadG
MKTGLSRSLRSLWRETRGVAAIEFALLVPILTVVLAAVVDFGQAFAASRKVNQISYRIADVISQSDEWRSSDVSNILTGAKSIILPFDMSNLEIVLTIVDVDKSGKETVEWSRADGTTAYTAGKASPVTIPAAIKENEVQFVAVEVTYSLSTPFAKLLKPVTGRDSYSFDESYILYPRVGETISLL